jgi:hypothetical protein
MQSTEVGKPFIRLSGAVPGTRVTLSFKASQQAITTIVAKQEYYATWRADTVMRMGPVGRPFPTYERRSLQNNNKRLQFASAFYKVPRVRW